MTEEQKEKRREYNKKWYQDNKEKILLESKKWRDDNKEKRREVNKKWYQDNKEKIKEKRREVSKKWYQDNKEKILLESKKWREDNKEKIREISKKWYQDNKEKVKEKAKKWRDDNKEKRREIHREWQKIKRESDPLFKLKDNLRRRIAMSITSKGHKKKTKTMEILGIDFVSFKQYIENQFEPWMNWDNYGKYMRDTFNHGWDIDHIIPSSSATTEEEIIKLNHYTNLRPLCSKINRDVKKATHHP
jgi:hypothetical protein